MRRLLAVLVVAGLLLCAGCVEGSEFQQPGAGAPDGSGPVPVSGGAGDLGADDRADCEDGDAEPVDAPLSQRETGDGTPAHLELHHLDAGQADATLLRTPAGETVLIDTGHWQDDGETVIEYLVALGVERIDHLVATHGHADHVGGHAAVIEHFETERDGIGAAYDSGVPHTTRTYEEYLDAIEAHEVDLLLVEAGDVLPLADCSVTATVLSPPAGAADDAEPGEAVDENGVALAVDYGDFRYVTTGDAPAATERRIVERWSDLDAHAYQAGHHGSSTSSSPALLDALSPAVAVISSAYDSPYGHPHDEVLAAFDERGIETYWTGVHGDVLVRTNGSMRVVEPEQRFSTDAADLLEAKPDGEDAAAPRPTATSPTSGSTAASASAHTNA